MGNNTNIIIILLASLNFQPNLSYFCYLLTLNSPYA